MHTTSDPARGAHSRVAVWRRTLALVVTAALAASTIAATSGASGLSTNRPNATLTTLGTTGVVDGPLQPQVVADGFAVLFAVDEAADGGDRNGDGDDTDLVLHVLEVGTGSLAIDMVRNLGLALAPESMFVHGEEATAFLVDESAQGADLNGDGDTDDVVLHTWDDRAAEVSSSGLAVAADRLPEPARPVGVATFAAVVPEASQGADLNGDGDTDDDVLHVWEPRRALVTSTGRAYATIGLYAASGLPGHASITDGQLAFLVDEGADGRDADGDGDAADSVVHVVEPATGAVRSLGVAAHGLHDGGPGLLVVEADEAATGRDLDGDGTADSDPVLVTDGTAAGTAATGVEAMPAYDVMAERVAPAGPGAVALLPYEAGAVGDQLLRYDAADGTLTDTGGRTTRLVAGADGHVIFRDHASADFRVLRPDGSLYGTGVTGHWAHPLTDELVAIASSGGFREPDRIAAVFDLRTAEHWLPDLHLQPWGALAVQDGRIGLRAVEHADGPFHAMLDGDATAGEALPALWDLTTGRTRTLDIGALASWPTGDGDAVVAVDEVTTGDLNGDGDATDVVLVRARFGAPGDASGPVLDVRAREVAPGEAQLDVVATSADATPLVALGARPEGESRTALTPTDGTYDGPDETFGHTYAAGEGQQICIDALDADGDRSTACITVEEALPDDAAPVVRDVVAAPAVVHPGEDLRVDAVVDDTDTGGSAIAGATLLHDGADTAMTATEPPSDSAVEPYGVTIAAPASYGTHELCVTGTDTEGNTGPASCVTVEVRDLQAPLVTALGAAPDPVEEGEPLVLRATLDDTATGGSAITAAELSVDGAAVTTAARDGALDSPTEEVEAFLDHATGVGDHRLCVTVTDAAGATTDQTCTTFTVAAGEGPLVRDVAVAPSVVGLTAPTSLSAVIDDTETGGAFVAGASYTIDGEPAGELSTEDFDEPSESVATQVGGFSTPGDRELCVTGRDRNGNVSAEPGCVTLTVIDDVAPTVRELEVPDLVQLRAPFDVSAVGDDAASGGSAIARVEATVDGGGPITLPATDGTFDHAVEQATATLPAIDEPGTHELCVRATDTAGNASAAACATLTVADTLAPTVGDLTLPSGPVVVGEPFTFTFTADDTSTGGSPITSARATVAGGAGRATTAPVDGAWDDPNEVVTGKVEGTQQPGVLQVCVHATDAHGNHAEPLCDTVTVIGRSVSGTGSIPSALAPFADDATFDLDVRQTSDGLDGHLTYVDGPYSFVATSFDELRTDTSTVGHVSGRGTLAGAITCDFSLTAREGAHDDPEPGGLAFRLANCLMAPGVLYDSGSVRTLTGGSVTVRGG